MKRRRTRRGRRDSSVSGGQNPPPQSADISWPGASMPEMALENATQATEYLHRWLVTDRLLDKPHIVNFMADSLECCWKVRAGIPPDDKSKSYPGAAVAAGIATIDGVTASGGPHFKFDDLWLERLWHMRNQRHRDFDNRMARELVCDAFAHLFYEVDYALGKRLELTVTRETWQALVARPEVEAPLISVFARRLAPSRPVWSYLPCLSCARNTFDSLHRYCRFCFYSRETFVCTNHGKAAWSSDRRPYLVTADAIGSSPVCRACFGELALARRRALEGRNPPIHLGQCRSCGSGCFDLDGARCLLCGAGDPAWPEPEAQRHGLRRCRLCRRFFPSPPSGDRCCSRCSTLSPQCWACRAPVRPEVVIVVASHYFCRRCVRCVIRCPRCLTYVESRVPLARDINAILPVTIFDDDLLEDQSSSRGSYEIDWQREQELEEDQERERRHWALFEDEDRRALRPCAQCTALASDEHELLDSANRILRRANPVGSRDSQASEVRNEIIQTMGPAPSWRQQWHRLRQPRAPRENK